MAAKTMECVFIFALIWILIFFFMGINLYQLAEESKKSTQDLIQMEKELVKLNKENKELRSENMNNLQILQEKIQLSNAKLKSLTSELSKLKISSGNQTISYEKLRRRISNQIKEMWYLVSGRTKLLREYTPLEHRRDFEEFLDDFRELQQVTELDFDKLLTMNGDRVKRDYLAQQMSDLVQNRLLKLQHPEDCNSARKLVCTLNKKCGYACQMHHILYCFIIAYATQRTTVIDSNKWKYSKLGWNGYFLPVSNSCVTSWEGRSWSKYQNNHQVVHLPIENSLFPRPPQMPLSVPADLYDRILLFHGYPFVWWIGQFCKHIFKYQPELAEEIKRKKKLLKYQRPIVGVHIRRTDKIGKEAAFHSVDEYMYWVDIYYKKLALNQSVEKKNVFLATDDSSVLAEAREKYPEYTFLSDNGVSKTANLSSRYSHTSLKGVISDIELLSDTDYLVCTFSSQVCRLAYEIMNSKHTDASTRFQSLDDIYYFGGQQEHKVVAIHQHSPRGRSELELELGDVIKIAGNHWNGQAKGFHHTSKKEGVFPAYKVEDVHDVVPFPLYKDEKGEQ